MNLPFIAKNALVNTVCGVMLVHSLCSAADEVPQTYMPP